MRKVFRALLKILEGWINVEAIASGTIELHKRRVYTIIFATAFLSSLLGLASTLIMNEANIVTIGLVGSNIVFHPLAAFLVSKRDISLRVIDVTTIAFGSLMVALTLAAKFYISQGAGIPLEPLLLWIPIIYIFTFASFRYDTALKISALIWASFLLVSLPFLVTSIQDYSSFLTLQSHLINAAFITAFFFFASFQHHLQVAQRSADKMGQLAHTDELTQIANRRRIVELIRHEILRSARYGKPFSVILLDIDHFKKFNDNFGHEVGDQILQALSQRTLELIREVDTLSRWGGEEFLILLPETSYSEAMQKAKSLCKQIAASKLLDKHYITLSCGVTESSSVDTLELIYHRADAALYKAKHLGRNRVEGLYRVEAEAVLVRS